MEWPDTEARMRRSTTASAIKEWILKHGLQPGDPMPTELDLMHALGVSRSSVREACRTLATLDIVEVQHGKGMFVGQMSLAPMVRSLVFRGVISPGDDLQALREVVEVRQALELTVAEQVIAAHRDTPDQLLDQYVTEMITSAQAGKPFTATDRQFHTRLLERLDNKLFGQLVGAFWDIHMAVLPRLKVAMPADLTQTAHAHGKMLAAARAGDSDGYRTAVIEHYEPLRRCLAESSK